MPEPIDLAYAIGLPPHEAIEYFEAKGYKITWNWYDLWEQAHAKAFTVAKVMRMDILMDIREMINKALKEGITFEQFKKELEPKLRAKGWWGVKFVSHPDGKVERIVEGTPWRLETIFRTNMQSAYMAGRYKAFMENVDDRPYWQYVAVLDRKTRPAHRALHGKVFRYDDPFWQTHFPPNGFNCFSDDTEIYTNEGWKLFKELHGKEDILTLNPITKNIEWQKAIRWYEEKYEGIMFHFKAWNFDLMCTPNHNLLVRKSWDRHEHRDRLRLIEAINIADSDQFYRTCIWQGESKDAYLEIFDAQTFAKFMGYWLSEGSISFNNKENRYVIKISQYNQANKEKIIQDLWKIKDLLWIGENAIYIKPIPSIVEYLKNFKEEKYIPQEIREMNKEHIRNFLDAYLLGDGYVYKEKIMESGYVRKKIRCYTTSNKKIADVLSELILKTGYCPSFSFSERKGKWQQFRNGLYQLKTDLYYIRELRGNYFTFRKKYLNKIWYSGYIYCVEVPKYHVILVRRNNKIVWAGNCRCQVRALSQQDIDERKIVVDTAVGKIKWEDQLVSKKTGEMRPVAVYHDPVTGMKIPTDIGFSYNPGQAAWFPDLDKYPYDVAKQWVEGGLTGRDFKSFFEGKIKGLFPIAVLDKKFKEAIGSQSQVVYLSDETLQKNLTKHPEIDFTIYVNLPNIISKAQLVVQDKENTFVFLRIGGKIYYGVIKTTKSRKKNFLISLRLARLKDIELIKKKGKILKDNLKM